LITWYHQDQELADRCAGRGIGSTLFADLFRAQAFGPDCEPPGG